MVTRRVLLSRGARALCALSPLALPPVVRPDRAAATESLLARRPPAGPAPPLPGTLPGTLPLVMLDPGHGGRDSGAIGVTGTLEKHVALAAAQELQRQLQVTGRYRVVLTRQDDVFIPLQERVGIAQAHGAGLFVSMHADALGDHSVRGASVYTLSEAASDSQSAALALSENAADRFGGAAVQQTSPEIATILASLVTEETRAGSAHLARGLVGELGRDVRLLHDPARHAGFVVLKAPDIPSVLVEMGFMSNAADEAALRRPEHRAQVAEAMRRAIDGFFATTPVRIAG